MCCNDFWKRRMEQKKNERAGYVLMFRSSEILLSLKLHTYFYHLCQLYSLSLSLSSLSLTARALYDK